MTCNVAADMLKRNVLGGLFWRAAAADDNARDQATT